MLANIIQYYKDCLKLSGRLGRAEFVKRFIFLIIPLIFLYIIMMINDGISSITGSETIYGNKYLHYLFLSIRISPLIIFKISFLR